MTTFERRAEYLLTRICAKIEDKEVHDILEEVRQKFPEEEDGLSVKESHLKDKVEELYKLYPTKCPISGRNLGKSSKDKHTIATRIAKLGYDKLKSTIIKYIDTCVKDNSYMKNFSTFLNNIPDYSEETITENKEQTKWQ